MALTAATARDTIREITPRWLRSGIAGKVLYACAVQLDAIAQAAAEGAAQQFPSRAGADALGHLGRDRRIVRGPLEPPSTYLVRLQRWLDDHRTRGNPYTLLQQVGEFWASAFEVLLVYTNGLKFTRAVGGSIARDVSAIAPSASADWSHWWLILDGIDASDDGYWSDPGTWSDGGTWDTDLTVQEVENIKAVPANWNAAHCIGHIGMVSGDGELWDYPEGTWSDPGTWGLWASGGAAVIDL